MAIINLYSKKNRPVPDVFIYNSLPEKLKIQVIHIWEDFFSQNEEGEELIKSIWRHIHKTLCREHGKKDLLPKYSSYTESYKVTTYFESTNEVEICLDVIELIFKYIHRTPKFFASIKHEKIKFSYTPEEAIKDLNTRFLENATGFEFRNNEIIRIDNQLLHKEVIISTLQFLSEPIFQNGNDEYLSAHEHFRHGRTKECLNDCLKALETTLKIICDSNGWTYSQKDTAAALIKVVIDNKLIPEFLLQHFSSLRSSLESGVPTFRNRLGGHGQGAERIEVPMHFASYMLYLTGSNINFLVSCHKDLQ